MINYIQSTKYEIQLTKKITPVDPGIYHPPSLLRSRILLNTLMMTNLDCSMKIHVSEIAHFFAQIIPICFDTISENLC